MMLAIVPRELDVTIVATLKLTAVLADIATGEGIFLTHAWLL